MSSDFGGLTIGVFGGLASGTAEAQGVLLQLPTADQRMIEAQLGPGVLGKALPSKPIADASIYFPLQEVASTYQVIAGPNAGKNPNSGRR